MILAAVALAAQPAPALTPRPVEEAFIAICWEDLANPAAVRRAIGRSRFGLARAGDDNGFEIYRATGVEIRFRPGEGCRLEVVLPDPDAGERVVERVAAAIGLSPPQGSVNRPGTEAHYSWRRPEQAGQRGLSAVLFFGRPIGGPARPARLSLWAYLASGH